MARGIRGLPLAYMAVGGVLVFSGVENVTVGGVLRQLARGQRPSGGPGAQAPADASGGGVPGPGDTGAHSASAAANQALLRPLAAARGWGTGQQWADLVSLWNRESGWSSTAYNVSGAYGIAQALGHAGAGDAAVGPRSDGSTEPGLNESYGAQYGLSGADARAANGGSAFQQGRWGLGYIAAQYQTPSGAWAHEESHGWY